MNMAPQFGGCLLLLVTLSQALVGSTAFWVFTGPSVVRVCLRERALLLCLVTRDGVELDLAQLGVQWSRDGQRLLKYEGGVQIGRAGAALRETELRRGNASLALHRITQSDCGRYTCQVTYRGQRAAVSMNLQLRDATREHCT